MSRELGACLISAMSRTGIAIPLGPAHTKRITEVGQYCSYRLPCDRFFLNLKELMQQQVNYFIILLLLFINGNYCTDLDSVLECYRRIYNYTIIKKDNYGRSCWDTIPAVSCWGRCDSREIPDWKFPYKKSFHPVCIHDFQEPKNIILRNCDDDVESGTEIFKFHQALSCKCSVCKSSEASCEGIKEKETNFHPQLIW
ncbi:hypothetical protein PGB90_008446 [Kerria lacca]